MEVLNTKNIFRVTPEKKRDQNFFGFFRFSGLVKSLIKLLLLYKLDNCEVEWYSELYNVELYNELDNYFFVWPIKWKKKNGKKWWVKYIRFKNIFLNYFLHNKFYMDVELYEWKRYKSPPTQTLLGFYIG